MIVCPVRLKLNRWKSYPCCSRRYGMWSQQWQGVHCEVESKEPEAKSQSGTICEPEVASVYDDSPIVW